MESGKNEVRNVHSKLAEARLMIQKKEIKKSGINTYAHFKYYELSDILSVINMVFYELGLVGVYNITDEIASLSIVNTEKPEETICFTTTTKLDGAEAKMGNDAMSVKMQPIQRLGSIKTYTKRYLYLDALEISEYDTVDALEQVIQQPKSKQEPKTENAKLKDFVVEKKLDIKLVAQKFNLNGESKETDFVKALANLQTMSPEQLNDFLKE